jgi:hypothetical protein
VQEEALELGERVRREQHQRQVEGAQDEESRRLWDLWEGKKRKRATGREDEVGAGNVDGASHGRFQEGALGQSRAKAARAGRSGALRVTRAAASAGRREKPRGGSSRSRMTLGHVATSSTFFFTTSETPLQVPFKTTCLTPVDAILRSVVAEVDRPAGCAAVAPTAGGRRTASWPAHQRSRKSRTKSELLSLIFHSVGP